MKDDTILRISGAGLIFGAYVVAALQGHDGILFTFVTNAIIFIILKNPGDVKQWLNKRGLNSQTNNTRISE